MTRAQLLRAKADSFAARAASAKARTQRNTFLSLEQAVRSLAAMEERDESARQGEAATQG
jgi:hypothetical protein